jgi:hypothetical protein
MPKGIRVRVPSLALDNQTKIVYDCPISGVSSAVERYPSKLDVVGSIPIPRSEPLGSLYTQTHRIITMTPYELRFEIFKQAYNMLNDQYSIEMDTARYWNANSANTVKMDYPEFPTLQDVLNQAETINDFVSSK